MWVFCNYTAKFGNLVSWIVSLQFSKPGTSADYPEMAQEAVKKALSDAKLNYNEIEQACVGYVYGEQTLIKSDDYYSVQLASWANL